MTNSAWEVPFTVDADLDLGRAADPWLRPSGADVVVRRGVVPEMLLARFDAQDAKIQRVAHRVLIKPPGMRILVEGGDTIRYATEPGVADIDVRAFLLALPWATLVLQRGLLPLHASAVAVGPNVFAFAGDSGAGKSTLAAALAARRRGFFEDDLLILDPESHGSATRCWRCRGLKLWPDAVAMTGAEARHRVRAKNVSDKRYAAPAALSLRATGRLKKLYVLIQGDADTACRITELDARDSLHALSQAIYCRLIAIAIAGRPRLFQWLATLARNVSVLHFKRPLAPSRFDDAIAYLDGALLTPMAGRADEGATSGPVRGAWPAVRLAPYCSSWEASD